MTETLSTPALAQRDLAQEVIDSIPESDPPTTAPDIWVSSTGVTFRVRAVSPHITMDAGRNLRPPEVPKVHIVDDDRYEENPNDPEYKKALADWRFRAGELSNAVMITRGTTLVLPLPEGVEAPESTEWSDDLKEFAGLEIPNNGRGRMYAWIKYVALPTLDDFTGLYYAVARKSGMTQEAAVAQAIEDFRSVPERGADNDVPVGEEAGHEDSSTVSEPR